MLDEFKETAQRERISMNALVESYLNDFVCHVPNETTLAAMKEAEEGIWEGTVDTSSVEAMIKSILGDEEDERDTI